MSLASLMTDTVSIVRPTAGRDSIGGPTAGTTVVTETAAYIEPMGGKEDLAERNTSVGTWTVYLPADTDVQHTDYLVWGTRTFEIVAPPRPFEGSPTVRHIEVALEEVL